MHGQWVSMHAAYKVLDMDLQANYDWILVLAACCLPDLYCSQHMICSCQCCSSWLPPVAPTPSVPQARTASRSGASDGSSRQPPGSSASGVRPQTDAPVSTFNTHPQLCHEAPSPGSTHPSLHSDSPDGQPMACSLSLCAAEVPESHPSCHPAISLGCPGASDNQQHCHGKSALPLQDIQLTYGSRKRQRTAGHCSGSGAKQKQTADYAWLQGADETPSAAPHHQGSQAYKSSTLWCNLEAEQMTAAEASSSRAENPDNTDATLIWYAAETAGTGCFNPKTGRYHYAFSGHTKPVMQVLPLQNGLHILTSSHDGTHKLWTVEGSGLCTFTAPSGDQWIAAACLSKCESFVIAGHCSSIYVWDIRSVLGDAGLVPDTSPGGNHCNQLQFHDCTLTAVALSRCDTMMASTDASGKLVVHFSSCL
ncbi:TPA: hypothetical protein ACH3X2_14308 [Trebouxia sp. C0005]